MLVSLPGAFFVGDILAGKRPTEQAEQNTMTVEKQQK
jgi:hypothetical protein